MDAKSLKGDKPSKSSQLPPDIQQVKDAITEIVAPVHRANINVIPDHVLLLHGTKSTKQLIRKRKAVKKQTLTRREYSEIGLYTLPTKSMKYDNLLELHELWKGYIKEHLSLPSMENIPTASEPQYDGFSKLLMKADLHGAKLSITRSKCPSFVGLSGIVVLDTKNTLKILGVDNKLRTVPKTECIFTIELGKLVFTIVGKHLTIRPAERSVKKMKNFMDLDL